MRYLCHTPGEWHVTAGLRGQVLAGRQILCHRTGRQLHRRVQARAGVVHGAPGPRRSERAGTLQLPLSKCIYSHVRELLLTIAALHFAVIQLEP
jgi:hypothetical protein